MKKTLLYAVFIGFLLRILLILTTYHQDLGAITLSSKYILSGHLLDFYKFSGLDESKTIFNYQPLAYIIPSLVYLPFSDFVKNTGDLFINNSWLISQEINYSVYLLLYKLPMLLADIGIFLLLPRFFKTQKEKHYSQILWALCPVAIYVSSIIGQVDIVIAFMLLYSLYEFNKKNFIFSSILIGIASLIKPIGLILLPFITTGSFKEHLSLKKSAVIFAAGFGTYLLGILPYINIESYRYYALFANQIGKSTNAGIAIASGTQIPYFFISYILIFLTYMQKKVNILKPFFLAILSSLAFTHFHPQWYIWFMPLLILTSLQKSNYLVMLGMISAWFLVLLSFDNTLFLGSFLKPMFLFPDQIRQNNMFQLLVQLARSFPIAYLFYHFYEKDQD